MSKPIQARHLDALSTAAEFGDFEANAVPPLRDFIEMKGDYIRRFKPKPRRPPLVDFNGILCRVTGMETGLDGVTTVSCEAFGPTPEGWIAEGGEE